MRVLVFFVELLFWLLVIRFVLRGLARLFGQAPNRRTPTPPGPPPPRQVEDLVLDPVCRTYIPRSRAVLARVAGRDEAFCSTECRDKAKAAIARAS